MLLHLARTMPLDVRELQVFVRQQGSQVMLQYASIGIGGACQNRYPADCSGLVGCTRYAAGLKDKCVAHLAFSFLFQNPSTLDPRLSGSMIERCFAEWMINGDLYVS